MRDHLEVSIILMVVLRGEKSNLRLIFVFHDNCVVVLSSLKSKCDCTKLQVDIASVFGNSCKLAVSLGSS